MPKRILDRITEGDFSHMLQETHADGTVIVTLTKFGDKNIQKAKVSGLYTKEAVASDETIIAKGG